MRHKCDPAGLNTLGWRVFKCGKKTNFKTELQATFLPSRDISMQNTPKCPHGHFYVIWARVENSKSLKSCVSKKQSLRMLRFGLIDTPLYILNDKLTNVSGRLFVRFCMSGRNGEFRLRSREAPREFWAGRMVLSTSQNRENYLRGFGNCHRKQLFPPTENILKVKDPFLYFTLLEKLHQMYAWATTN